MAGLDWAVAVVAAAVDADVEQVEAGVRRWRARGSSCRRGAGRMAGRTVSGSYQFRHALYQQVVYDRIAAAVACGCIAASASEWRPGRRGGRGAAELAVHFEQGRDYARAVHYLRQAGENALRRSTHPEAVALLTQGLALLAQPPKTPARVQQELDLQLALGPALIATRGQAPQR